MTYTDGRVLKLRVIEKSHHKKQYTKIAADKMDTEGYNFKSNQINLLSEHQYKDV